MATADALKEISSVRAFFKARCEVVTTTNSTLQKSFADTLIGIMDGFKTFGPSEGSQLVEALKDKPYGEMQTTRICETIDTKLGSSIRETKEGRVSSNKQFLKEWYNYLTEEDWEVLLKEKGSWHSKENCLIERGLSVGLFEPDEQTLKWLLATLLLAHYNELPSAQSIYDKLSCARAFVTLVIIP